MNLFTKIISRSRKPRQLCKTYVIEPKVRSINPRELDPALKTPANKTGIICRN